MTESHITVGVLIASVLLASIQIFLKSRTYAYQIETVGGVYPIEMPELTPLSFLNKLSLLVYSAKRLFYDHPGKGLAAALQIQQQLGKSEQCTGVTKKTIYFIRHGQSAWNHTFDISRGIFKVIMSTVQLVFLETLFIFSNDTFVFDTPLSTKGINQALEYAKNLSDGNCSNTEELRILAGIDPTKSALFASNLRRAQSTLMLLLQDRLKKTKEKITVLGELEEVVSNPDCVSLHTNFGKSTVPLMELMLVPDETRRYSSTLMKGNKDDVYSLSMYEKMLAFNDRIFKQPEEVIIVCGHSRWIRYYLDIFLPQGADVEYRHKKIGNVETIRLDVVRRELSNNDHMYLIDQNSVKLLYKNTV